jgi:hypothetical protein
MKIKSEKFGEFINKKFFNENDSLFKEELYSLSPTIKLQRILFFDNNKLSRQDGPATIIFDEFERIIVENFYIDDILLKSKRYDYHLDSLETLYFINCKDASMQTLHREDGPAIYVTSIDGKIIKRQRFYYKGVIKNFKTLKNFLKFVESKNVMNYFS